MATENGGYHPVIPPAAQSAQAKEAYAERMKRDFNFDPRAGWALMP